MIDQSSLSLAELIAEYREKDVKKLASANEVLRLNTLLQQGLVGKVTITVREVEKDDVSGRFAFTYKLIDSIDGGASDDEEKLYDMNKDVDFLVNKKDSVIKVQCIETAADDDGNEQKKVYNLDFNCEPLSDEDIECQETIDATVLDEEGHIVDAVSLQILACFTGFEALSQREMEKLSMYDDEMAELAAMIKEAKQMAAAPPAPSAKAKGGKKTGKKGGKKSASIDIDQLDRDEDVIDAPPSSFLTTTVSFIVTYAIEYRQVFLFGAVASGIYFLGDNASL